MNENVLVLLDCHIQISRVLSLNITSRWQCIPVYTRHSVDELLYVCVGSSGPVCIGCACVCVRACLCVCAHLHALVK